MPASSTATGHPIIPENRARANIVAAYIDGKRP
jgi:hypothetical protein